MEQDEGDERLTRCSAGARAVVLETTIPKHSGDTLPVRLLVPRYLYIAAAAVLATPTPPHSDSMGEEEEAGTGTLMPERLGLRYLVVGWGLEHMWWGNAAAAVVVDVVADADVAGGFLEGDGGLGGCIFLLGWVGLGRRIGVVVAVGDVTLGVVKMVVVLCLRGVCWNGLSVLRLRGTR